MHFTLLDDGVKGWDGDPESFVHGHARASRTRQFSALSASVAKRAWARLIKQVYEVDPLVCPCGTGPMGPIAFLVQPEVIGKLLRHLALWPATAHRPPAHSLAAESGRPRSRALGLLARRRPWRGPSLTAKQGAPGCA